MKLTISWLVAEFAHLFLLYYDILFFVYQDTDFIFITIENCGQKHNVSDVIT